MVSFLCGEDASGPWHHPHHSDPPFSKSRLCLFLRFFRARVAAKMQKPDEFCGRDAVIPPLRQAERTFARRLIGHAGNCVMCRLEDCVTRGRVGAGMKPHDLFKLLDQRDESRCCRSRSSCSSRSRLGSPGCRLLSARKSHNWCRWRSQAFLRTRLLFSLSLKSQTSIVVPLAVVVPGIEPPAHLIAAGSRGGKAENCVFAAWPWVRTEGVRRDNGPMYPSAAHRPPSR